MVRAADDFAEIRRHMRPTIVMGHARPPLMIENKSPSLCPRRNEECAESCPYRSQCIDLRDRFGVFAGTH